MNKRSTKFYRKNEEEVMKRLGFKPTKNSGAGWIEKCDGQNEQCICELKSTDKESYRLSQQTLHTLDYHAAVAHKLPVFALQFLNTGEVWVMIKPEDLGLIQSLVKGEDISDKLQTGFDFDVDNEEEIIDSFVDKEVKEKYNIYMPSRKAGKSYLARQAYMKQKAKERKEQEQEYKQRLKERRKQIGKEIETKRDCNI